MPILRIHNPKIQAKQLAGLVSLQFLTINLQNNTTSLHNTQTSNLNLFGEN